MRKGRFSAEQIIRADGPQKRVIPACVQRVRDSAGPVMPTRQNVPHAPTVANRTPASSDALNRLPDSALGSLLGGWLLCGQ
jgi:hypothetical protein